MSNRNQNNHIGRRGLIALYEQMYKDKVFIMGSPAYNRMQVLKDRLYTQRILGSTYLNKKYKMQNDLMKRLKASGEIQ